MKYEEIAKKLKSLSNKKNREGMARYGIKTENAFGIPIPQLRNIAKDAGKNHDIALKLWESGIHEARILASMIDDPAMVAEKQIESWVKDFDSWDVCDQVVHLFEEAGFGYKKIIEWSSREEEFVKRAAFALMAALSVHDKKADDGTFVKFLTIIKRESGDNRNYVRKAVNWALRNIGKRNKNLNEMAVKTAQEIQKIDSKSAKWIASDAIRELTNPKIRQRLERK
jgi:3-methyladenine DNA glycosylase AlkD